MKFYDVHGNEVVKPEDVEVRHRLAIYGVTFLHGTKRLVFARGVLSGKLVLPGGKLELGESFRECLRREGEEETGYRITLSSPGPIAIHGPTGFCIPEWDRYYWAVGMIFAATAYHRPDASFTPDPEEVSEVVIVERDKLDYSDIHPMFRYAVLRAIKRYR